MIINLATLDWPKDDETLARELGLRANVVAAKRTLYIFNKPH